MNSRHSTHLYHVFPVNESKFCKKNMDKVMLYWNGVLMWMWRSSVFGKDRCIFDLLSAVHTLQKLKSSFNLPRVISVAASSPDNVQTSADQQIVLLNPFMEAQ